MWGMAAGGGLGAHTTQVCSNPQELFFRGLEHAHSAHIRAVPSRELDSSDRPSRENSSERDARLVAVQPDDLPAVRGVEHVHVGVSPPATTRRPSGLTATANSARRALVERSRRTRPCARPTTAPAPSCPALHGAARRLAGTRPRAPRRCGPGARAARARARSTGAPRRPEQAPAKRARRRATTRASSMRAASRTVRSGASVGQRHATTVESSPAVSSARAVRRERDREHRARVRDHFMRRHARRDVHHADRAQPSPASSSPPA